MGEIVLFWAVIRLELMGRMHEKREEEEDDDVGARLTGWRARRGRKC